MKIKTGERTYTKIKSCFREFKKENIIKFDPLTQRLGLASFDFCPIYEKGILKRIFITRIQQEKKGDYYIEIDNMREENVEKQTQHIFIDYDQKCWNKYSIWRCIVHDTLSISINVPRDANVLYCDHIGSDIWFKFNREEKIKWNQ